VKAGEAAPSRRLLQVYAVEEFPVPFQCLFCRGEEAIGVFRLRSSKYLG
jgi:hypothetical protein